MIKIPPLTISNSEWAFAAFLFLFYGLRWQRNRSKLPLPPGPKKLPLVGNLFDIPAERQWETYFEWSKRYNSDIIHLNAAGTSIIVLSSMEAIKELFQRRSSLYSDRPPSPMLTELMGWDYATGLLKYGDRWRSHRKILYETFNVVAAKQFQTQELAAAHELLRRILEDPHDPIKHFRHMLGALVMDVTYGIRVRSSDDPCINLVEAAMHGFSIATIPGTFLVSMGTATMSFTSLNLRTLDDFTGRQREQQEADVKAAAATIYAAGADTTVSALGTFILGMLMNPEAQKKAQAEIDSVVGAGHLPDFADEAALPYVSAIVKEVLRWRNATPIAIPHYLAVDDEYLGYRIPAGSIVIGNVWAILHDENVYPDPQSFRPERFLLDGKLNPAITDPETAAFGFGRRICPGRHLAASALWIVVASILSTLNINKLVDKDGNVVEPSYEYFPGLVSIPLPFECAITPRSRQSVEIIQATKE